MGKDDKKFITFDFDHRAPCSPHSNGIGIVSAPGGRSYGPRSPCAQADPAPPASWHSVQLQARHRIERRVALIVAPRQEELTTRPTMVVVKQTLSLSSGAISSVNYVVSSSTFAPFSFPKALGAGLIVTRIENTQSCFV